MKVSTEKAGVVKLGLIGDEVAEFAGCVVHRDQLVEDHGIGHAVGHQGLVYAPIGVPGDLLLARFILRLEVELHAAGLARYEAVAFRNPVRVQGSSTRNAAELLLVVHRVVERRAVVLPD